MRYVSTRGQSPDCDVESALLAGLAPDGGLYVPSLLPRVDVDKVVNEVDVLRPFFEGSELILENLEIISKEAYKNSVEVKELDSQNIFLELFHGPTSAFKDYGAIFFANVLNLISNRSNFSKTVLVATSGDTGGAVASAFSQFPIPVEVYFPISGVSERQKKQLTCWGGAIKSFAVEGVFDDCQKIVKTRLGNSSEMYTTANSINLCRLLPQVAYFAMTSLKYPNYSYVIPSGNMGNSVAAFWAKRMGFPIEKIYIATNENVAVKNFFDTLELKKFETINTLANAMDVGLPSNLERLKALYSSRSELGKDSDTQKVSDKDIKEAILETYEKFEYVICPHTATAVSYAQKIKEPKIIVSTAHPAKFETIVEPIIGDRIDLPVNLKKLLQLPSKYEVISSDELPSKK